MKIDREHQDLLRDQTLDRMFVTFRAPYGRFLTALCSVYR